MAADSELDEPLIEFFKGSNIKAMQRVLERAQKKAETAARKLSSATRPQKRPGLLVKAMNHAMSAYGRSTKNGPSIRQTAPDTGGRPYHFGYSTVSKGQSTRGRQKSAGGAGTAAGGAPGAAPADSPTGKTADKGRKGANTAEAAHQIYTERDGAVDHDSPALDPAAEAGRSAGIDGAGIDGEGPGVAREAGADRAAGAAMGARSFVESVGRDGGVGAAATEAAAQAYIEDPDKVPALMGQRSSFGTIGETLAERLAFWDLVHERESDNGGRTQTRMVLELPHEATAEERHEIVRLFTDDLRRKDIPFWASIHAPTRENDARNHHAHVVCTDRPMRRMPHPETGEMTWDFAIAVTKTKRVSRNRVTSYPYRQNRDPEMRERGYVKQSRARLAEVVNDVMTRSSRGVRYDARSYRDMGLDVAPMRNVARVLADKLGKRSFVVMDGDWTRKMIDAEMQAAAARRSAAFVKLQEAEVELHEAGKAADRRAREAGRPRLTGKLVRALTDAAFEALLTVKRNRLATRFVNEATASTLEHIIKATGADGATKRAHDPAMAPDAGAMAALHEAATEELEEHRYRERGAMQYFRAREHVLTQAWKRNGFSTMPIYPVATAATARAEARTATALMPYSQPFAADANALVAARRLREPDHDENNAAIPGRLGEAHNITTGWLNGLTSQGLTGREFAQATEAMIRDLAQARRRRNAAEGEAAPAQTAPAAAARSGAAPPAAAPAPHSTAQAAVSTAPSAAQAPVSRPAAAAGHEPIRQPATPRLAKLEPQRSLKEAPRTPPKPWVQREPQRPLLEKPPAAWASNLTVPAPQRPLMEKQALRPAPLQPQQPLMDPPEIRQPADPVPAATNPASTAPMVRPAPTHRSPAPTAPNTVSIKPPAARLPRQASSASPTAPSSDSPPQQPITVYPANEARAVSGSRRSMAPSAGTTVVATPTRTTTPVRAPSQTERASNFSRRFPDQPAQAAAPPKKAEAAPAAAEPSKPAPEMPPHEPKSNEQLVEEEAARARRRRAILARRRRDGPSM